MVHKKHLKYILTNKTNGRGIHSHYSCNQKLFLKMTQTKVTTCSSQKIANPLKDPSKYKTGASHQING